MATALSFRTHYDYLSLQGKKSYFNDDIQIESIGNEVFIFGGGYREYVPMKDKWWWIFTGKTWESEVRRIKKDMEMKVWNDKKEREKINYQVERLK